MNKKRVSGALKKHKGELVMFHQKRKFVLTLCLLISLVLVAGSAAFASGGGFTEGKTAIVIANFGTTVPEAVKSLTNISEMVKKTFPRTEVRITFTSNIVRPVWLLYRPQWDHLKNRCCPYTQNLQMYESSVLRCSILSG